MLINRPRCLSIPFDAKQIQHSTRLTTKIGGKHWYSAVFLFSKFEYVCFLSYVVLVYVDVVFYMQTILRLDTHMKRLTLSTQHVPISPMQTILIEHSIVFFVVMHRAL